MKYSRQIHSSEVCQTYFCTPAQTSSEISPEFLYIICFVPTK